MFIYIFFWGAGNNTVGNCWDLYRLGFVSIDLAVARVIFIIIISFFIHCNFFFSCRMMRSMLIQPAAVLEASIYRRKNGESSGNKRKHWY